MAILLREIIHAIQMHAPLPLDPKLVNDDDVVVPMPFTYKTERSILLYLLKLNPGGTPRELPQPSEFDNEKKHKKAVQREKRNRRRIRKFGADSPGPESDKHISVEPESDSDDSSEGTKPYAVPEKWKTERGVKLCYEMDPSSESGGSDGEDSEAEEPKVKDPEVWPDPEDDFTML
jgi:hypothetical protein